MKTVEIIVEKKPWDRNGGKIPGNKIMPLCVGYDEVKIGSIVKAARGRCNKEENVWELPFKEVMALGLENRIVKN